MPAQYGSLPFDEAIRFFRGKDLVPTDRWADVWKAEHDVSFMVAGAAKADLLADLHGAMLKGVAKGTTLAEFRKDFDAIVARHGWTGWKGEESDAGRAWRTRLIYDTNLRMSYQAGRWAQVQAGKQWRPYLEYKHSDLSAHPRPLHKSWDGLVVAVDDPWVQTHWPPNGWGCKCRMFALAERDLRRMGKTGPDTPPDDGSYDWTDKVTGEVHRVPNGIDPGWDYAPGASRTDLMRKEIERKVAKLPLEIGKALQEDVSRLGMPSLHSTLEEVEGEIAKSGVEQTVALASDGTELLRKVGDANSVAFSAEELALLKDSVVTHNHPVVTSFSIEDVALLIRFDLAELRAVDVQWTYVLARVGSPLTNAEKQALIAHAEELEAAGWGDALKKLRSGEIDQAEFNDNLYHWIWGGLNDSNRLSYRREAR